MDNDEELYIGHVAPEGIYLSWKHFLFGYSDNSDNINVAVHEMSHALLFNNYFAKYGVDKISGPIMKNFQQRPVLYWQM
jgi:hypothetical protein